MSLLKKHCLISRTTPVKSMIHLGIFSYNARLFPNLSRTHHWKKNGPLCLKLRALRLFDKRDECGRRWHDEAKRQKIPLSCHNNPNLFEDGADEQVVGDPCADRCPAMMNVSTLQTGLAMMFLSNGLIAQLILRPVLGRSVLMWKQLYFLAD